MLNGLGCPTSPNPCPCPFNWFGFVVGRVVLEVEGEVGLKGSTPQLTFPCLFVGKEGGGLGGLG